MNVAEKFRKEMQGEHKGTDVRMRERKREGGMSPYE